MVLVVVDGDVAGIQIRDVAIAAPVEQSGAQVSDDSDDNENDNESSDDNDNDDADDGNDND